MKEFAKKELKVLCGDIQAKVQSIFESRKKIKRPKMIALKLPKYEKEL